MPSLSSSGSRKRRGLKGGGRSRGTRVPVWSARRTACGVPTRTSARPAPTSSASACCVWRWRPRARSQRCCHRRCWHRRLQCAAAVRTADDERDVAARAARAAAGSPWRPAARAHATAAARAAGAARRARDAKEHGEASVLPEPVSEWITRSSCFAIRSIAAACTASAPQSPLHAMTTRATDERE